MSEAQVVAVVLLVEDDAALREAVTAALQQRGYTVRAVERAADALHLTTAQPIDVIISDVDLPDHSGLWLWAELEARGSGLTQRTVLVSAREDLPVPSGVPFLRKPFHLEALVDAVERLRVALARAG